MIFQLNLLLSKNLFHNNQTYNYIRGPFDFTSEELIFFQL